MIHLIRRILVLVFTQLEKSMIGFLRPYVCRCAPDTEQSWSQAEEDAFFKALLYIMLF